MADKNSPQPDQTPPTDPVEDGGLTGAPEHEAVGSPSGDVEQDAVESALAEAQASIREIQAAADGTASGLADDGAGEQAPQEASAGVASADGASDAADAAMAAMMAGMAGVAESDGPDASGIELLGDVELQVMVELGRTQMMVEDVLKLGQGAVVELDKLAGDPVDVYVNNRLVARGEVLVLNDNFCIRISEIVADLELQAEAAARQEAGA